VKEVKEIKDKRLKGNRRMMYEKIDNIKMGWKL
jgi:hypothetical protein